MSLVVEDGTGLANADSYQTLEDARLNANALGLNLPASEEAAEAALRNGARYVNRYESSFTGYRTVDTQALSFPRTNSIRSFGTNCIDVASNAIPNELIMAQMFAAVEYGKGTDVMPVDDGLSVQLKEVVGAVKKQFFNNGKTGKGIVITQAIDALKPLMGASSGGLSCRTVRR